MQVIPMLRFRCRAGEAFAFYAQVFNGRITTCLRYADLASPGDEVVPVALRDHVCHIRLEWSGGALIGADGCSDHDHASSDPIHLEVHSVIEAERLYRAMSEGGMEHLPMMETAWALRWGWVVDRFGKAWTVQCLKPQPTPQGLSAG